jgi:2-methylcitrate dehydratase PrpD
VSAAERLAAFAVGLRHDDVPRAVRQRAVLHVLDAIGCAYAASALGEGTEARSVAVAQGGAPEAAVIGTGERVPAVSAALANGTLMHALDYDDTHPGSICHITTVVAPAALATASATGASGRELVTAYIAGCETVARVGAAADGEFHRRGFHATGVCGVFGAAVAAARLLGLDAAATTRALGIAGSFAPGLLEFLGDGSSTKRLHAGGAARVGVEAARLAEAGATGPAGVLDGRYGVFATHLGDRHAAALAVQLDDLGTRWETAAMAIKPFPCCHFMHGALEALASLDLEADDVEAIDVRVADAGVGLILEPAADKPRPRTPYDAKFSLPFTAGALLVHGRVGVATFTPEGIDDEAAVAVAGRMTYEPVPLDEMANGFGGAVAVRTADGRTLAASVDHPRGSVAAPMSEADVRAKVRDNAVLALAAADVSALEAAILGADTEEVAPEPVP